MPHLKHQDKTHLFRFPMLYRFEIRGSVCLCYSLGNMLYGIRPCVATAWLLYTQTGRDVTCFADPWWKWRSITSWKPLGGGTGHYALLRGKQKGGEGTVWCLQLCCATNQRGVKQQVQAELSEWEGYSFSLCSGDFLLTNLDTAGDLS